MVNLQRICDQESLEDNIICFSPKIKTPTVDTSSMKAVEPAPLTETPKGVLFGGEDDTDSTSTSSEVSSGANRDKAKVGLKVDKPTESTKTGSGVKKSIASKVFGK